MKAVTNLKAFRNELIFWALIMAVVAELASLIAIGWDVTFLLGLAAGTAVSVTGVFILVGTGSALMLTGRKSPIILGYLARLIMYGTIFFICIRIAVPCGFGCIAGFVTLHFGIMFLYGIVYRFFRKKKNPLNDWTEPKQWKDLSEYDEEDDW
ncbi:MAG: hypothetical protein ACI4KL_06215 [Lentihominibacter sp.]